ncbi:hypothetical protein [Hansschlegelia sp.]|uniref:hypothetical protein n=1 Tax=Hansschlegelia sp. TaxID=2041892 RepID=UPI002BA5E6D0|nr:hypothetical protein [Hansschlegelia sp.]HVI27494.1 hypothetical protein [Hansschlegelia sp.]
MPSTDFPPINVSGLHARTVAVVLQIDEQCRELAARRLAEGPSAAKLRERIASYKASGASEWLVDFNRTAADLLDRDARLLALLDLQSYDRVTGNPRHFELNLYDELVREACGMPSASPCLALERASFARRATQRHFALGCEAAA